MRGRCNRGRGAATSFEVVCSVALNAAWSARGRHGTLGRVSDGEEPNGSWLVDRGIVDRPSGIAKAREAREWLLQAGGHVLGSASDYTVEIVVFSGLLARAQGLHEGALSAVEQDNPYAAFTLIRAYAETVAVVLYVTDKPQFLDRIWKHDALPLPVGKVTDYAVRRLGGFKDIYNDLSQYAHPASKSVVAASHRLKDSRQVEWSSVPSFRSEDDAIVACGWIVELAEACSNLLVEFATSWRSQRSVTEPEPGP